MIAKYLLLNSGKTLLTALLCLGGLNANAQALLSGPYSQNFDGLPQTGNFTNNTTIPGVYVAHNGTSASGVTAIAGGDGSVVTTGLRSFGNSADLALGGVRGAGTAVGDLYYGMRVKNTTGDPIKSLIIQYTIEQWRRPGGNPSATINFHYKKNVTDLGGTGWTALTTGNTSLNPGGGGGGATDGSAIRTVHTFVLNITLAANEEVMLRWQDANTSGFYIGLDDVSITPSVDQAAPIYYSKSNATDLTLPASWGPGADGSGTAPANFNSGMFVVANKTTASINSNWGLAAGTKVLISEGTFTIPAGFSINNAIIDVADNATLKIAGSIPLLGTLGRNSTVDYNGSGPQDVKNVTYGNLTISGSGTKMLNGKTTVNGTLSFLNSDLLATETDTLFLGPNATVNETSSHYFKGKMLKSATINGTGTTSFGNMGVTFTNTGGGNWGVVKVTRTTDAAIINPKDATKESIKRSWHISPQTQAGTPVNMTFKWLATEDNGQNFPATINALAQAWKSTDNGLTWKPVGNVFTFDASGTERTVSLTTSSFSIWTFSGPGNPLPVSWLYFKGKAANNGNNLNWATASEKNTAAFIVERSLNGKTFEAIGTVNAAGNSSQVLTYQFTDKKPVATGTAYYRLKQTDTDGAFEYSSIIAIAQQQQPTQFANAYPNPFEQTLNLELDSNHGLQKVVLLGLDGKEIYSKALTSASEVALHDLPNLKAGVYLLQLVSESGISTLKVVRQ
ncbi:T9SS type A sorting domain-containing protein [Adhaeribacter sp. BT258]|uniref:T9SS type A sorting domain-containing protein n=1 Tax=Adhaeribacter terrigena TaxID=2793070 RepID=A0ABS1C1Q7_9BACT|nr:T9SS type A sorting domain-containing protein [Adhaeribacter terrigena]MBK0403307.1 T9SS type A sorting domain-containing protein [Adhaeribacter terrigena]